MNIYELYGNGDFQHIAVEDANSTDNYFFHGPPKVGVWKPHPATLVTAWSADNVLKPADIITFSGKPIPLLNDVAVAAIGDWILAYGELLPQPCENTDDHWRVFNPTIVLDALDLDNSLVHRLPDSEHIVSIDEFAFLEDRIAGHEIFKVTAAPLRYTFITEAGIERLEASGLRIGLDFRLRWNGAVVPRDRQDVFRYGADETEPESSTSELDIVADNAQRAALAHIEQVYGPASGAFGYVVQPEFPVTVSGWAPTPDHPYTLLATSGMTRAWLEQPEHDDNILAVELVAALDTTWPTNIADGHQTGPGTNIIAHMKSLGQQLATTHLEPGMTLNNNPNGHPEPIDPAMSYTAWLFTDTNWLGLSPTADAYPNGSAGYIALWPLHTSELNYIVENGPDAFRELAPDPSIFTSPISPNRPPIV